MADVRGSLPLSYVHKKHWADWVRFLHAEKDKYWPNDTVGKTEPPALVLLPPNSRPMADPKHACSLELARMVASGRMKPYEIILLQITEQKTKIFSRSGDNETAIDSDSDDSTCSDNSTDSDDDDYTDSSADSLDSDLSIFENYEQEMAGLLNGLDMKL